MTSQFATLLFPDYATAVAAAKSLGFWDEDEDKLRTGGQTIREDGTAFSWMIDEIGQDPVVISGTYDENGDELTPPSRLSGYAVNCVGEMPEAALAYAIPFGSAGRVFAGGGPEPFHYEPIAEQPGYVVAVADPLPEDEP
jgi:hypothetical protein